jgi:RNA polymerase sigma factor (sigma-70 family)
MIKAAEGSVSGPATLSAKRTPAADYPPSSPTEISVVTVLDKRVVNNTRREGRGRRTQSNEFVVGLADHPPLTLRVIEYAIPPHWHITIQNWRRQLKEINSDIGNLLLSRHIFRETQELTRRQVWGRGLFAKWIRVNYASSALLGIRRQVDTDSNVVSLANLLRDLIRNPAVITRPVFLGFWLQGRFMREIKRSRGGSRQVQLIFLNAFALPGWNASFDRFAGAGRVPVDKALLGRDLNLLRSTCTELERFATKRLAHFDSQAPGRPTYLKIDQALDVIDSLLEKYNNLLGLRDWRAGTQFDALQRTPKTAIRHTRSVGDLVEAEIVRSPVEGVVRSKSAQRYRRLLAMLPPREEQILRMRFETDLTLNKIGRLFAISERSVHEIEAKALRKMRQTGRSARDIEGLRRGLDDHAAHRRNDYYH